MPPAYVLNNNTLSRRSTQECLNILTADDFDIFSGRSGRIQYDALTGAFTVGQVVTGAGSGHAGTIYAIEVDEDDAALGYLVLNECTGIFQNNDALTDPVTGVAVAIDTLVPHSGIWVGFTVVEAAVFLSLETGYEVKRNVLAGHSWPVGFPMVADLRSIQLTSGVIVAHKINES